jgi:chromate transport protein ChrA
MVQIVTYIGYRVRGIWGALAAAVAFVLPAFIALLALSAIYFKFQTLGVFFPSFFILFFSSLIMIGYGE